MGSERPYLFTAQNSTVGVIGLGYVGLPLVIRLCEMDFDVIGFDIDDEKVKALSAGNSYIDHIPDSAIAGANRAGFSAYSSFEAIADADVIVICVPTPLGLHREPNLSFIIATMDSICPFLRKGQLLSLESTTYPGTTDEVLLPRVQGAGFEIGEDFFIVFSPEREDPGNAEYKTHTIPKVVGGCTPNCLAAGTEFYNQFIDHVVPVSSTRAAEMTKLLENIHRAVNIGLVNEMKIIAAKMQIDIHEVIAAAATKPFGFVPYLPGPGLGGHCIPIDPFYLSWKAKEYGVNAKFIELAGEVNSSMPDYVVSNVVEGLNRRSKSVKDSKILIVGIAYKKNIGDMRESPSVVIMESLEDLGAVISYADPHVPVFPKLRGRRNFDLQSEVLDAEILKTFDAVIIATDHDSLDYDLIARNSLLIFDARGRYPNPQEHIIKC